MFLPLGARYSVDCALNPRCDREPNAFLSVGTAALLLQGMSVYFFSVLLKSDPIWIPDGTAVYYALHLDYFATPFALWFRQFEGVLQGLTYYVWVLELLGPILIFSPILHRPLRAALMVAFITMHLGFWMCLEIGLFPLIAIVMNLTFMPGWMWDALDRRLNRRYGADLRIWYDQDCDFCLKISRLIATFLFLKDVRILPAQSDTEIGELLEKTNSWVITVGEVKFLRWRGMQRLVYASPVFRLLATPMSWAPFARLGDQAYRCVAKNRPALAAATASATSGRPARTTPGRLNTALAGIALIFVTLQNISTLPSVGLRMPDEFRAARQFLGLYQHWTMFAPHPEITSPWPVIAGQLADGTIVDVLNGELGAPSLERPEVVSAVYANYRWRKYLSLMEDQSYENGPQTLALNYARYLCRLWNTGEEPHRMLMSFEIVFNVDWTNAPGAPDDRTVNSVWRHHCFG